MEVVVIVGGKLELAMCENGDGGQSGCVIRRGYVGKKWLSNLKWP